MTAQTAEKKHATPGTLEMLVGDFERTLPTAIDLSDNLRDYKLPTTDKGEVDMPAVIRYISDKGREYATSRGADPITTTPSDVDIRHALESKGVIENGRFSQAGISQILGLYAQAGSQYATGRAQGNLLRIPVEKGKVDGEQFATATGNFDAIPEIKGAHDQEGVARTTGQSLNEIAEKARSNAARGRFMQYLEGLKAYLPNLSHGAHAPAYAGAHK